MRKITPILPPPPLYIHGSWKLELLCWEGIQIKYQEDIKIIYIFYIRQEVEIKQEVAAFKK